MSLDAEIYKTLMIWGRDFGRDLRVSAVNALRSHGRTNPNTTTLAFEPDAEVGEGKGVLTIRATNGDKPVDYWLYIETGRRKGARGVPSDKLGKRWQNQNNIDPRVIIAQMNKKPVKRRKPLSFEKAAKQLSFVIQKSIKRKGIVPKPYIDRVINDGRLTELENDLTNLIGSEIKLTFKGIFNGSNR